MKTQKLEISGIPALLYGKESRKVYLYVHGKMGCKEEALPFAALGVPGDVVTAIMLSIRRDVLFTLRIAFRPPFFLFSL